MRFDGWKRGADLGSEAFPISVVIQLDDRFLYDKTRYGGEAHL